MTAKGRRAWRLPTGPKVLDYGHPTGTPALRAAVAEYLSRARGVSATADSVVITAGVTQGLALLARMFHRLGVRWAATEDPGFRRHRDLLQSSVLQTVALPVDDDGADPAGLAEGVGMVLLTPAHQHPIGVALTPGRRAEFAEWATRSGGYLVEDDYDGEFRYDRRPVGALQSLAPDRVVYAGSTSKSLAPGMRLGWLVVPPALRRPLLETIETSGAAVPVIDQLAFTDLLEHGHYDRHVRSIRAVQGRRRAELAQRLSGTGPAHLMGDLAGLHALLPVGSAAHEYRIIIAGRCAGLRLHGLHTAGYWHAPGEHHAGALVLGYATPAPHAWRQSLDLLESVLRNTPDGD